MFRRGELEFLLHPKQLEFWQKVQASLIRLHVFCVSRQWGKSHLLVVLCVIWALRKPRQMIRYGAPTKEMVERIVIPKLEDVLRFCPPELRPVQREDEWTFPNGSKIIIVGTNVNKGNRLRGVSSDLVVLDECRDMPHLEYLVETIIKPQFTTTGGLLLMASTPPDTPAHAFTAIYIDEAIRNDAFHHATFDTNPLITPEFLQGLLQREGIKSGSDAFRREYLADFSIVDNNNRVIKEFNEDANRAFFDTWKPARRMRPYVCMDIGSRDFTAMLFAEYDWEEGVLVVTHEWLKRNPLTSDIAKAIVDTEKQIWPHSVDRPDVKRYSDIDLRLSLDLKTDYGITVRPVEKPDKDAMVNLCNIRLAQGKIRIHPRCVQTIYQVKTTLWNALRTSYTRTEKGGHGDAVDALIYLSKMTNFQEAFADPVVLGPNQIRLKPEQRNTLPSIFDSLKRAA